MRYHSDQVSLLVAFAVLHRDGAVAKFPTTWSIDAAMRPISLQETPSRRLKMNMKTMPRRSRDLGD